MVSAAAISDRDSLSENSRQGVSTVTRNSRRASSRSKPQTALRKRAGLRRNGVRERNLYGYVLNDPVNRVDPLGLLYTDYNVTVGYGLGVTAGVMVDANGYYPYAGLAITTPGVSMSVTTSTSEVSTGFAVGAQATFGVAGQVGYGFGEGGGWFGEVGGGFPPGGSVTGYYVPGPLPPFDPNGGQIPLDQFELIPRKKPNPSDGPKSRACPR